MTLSDFFFFVSLAIFLHLLEALHNVRISAFIFKRIALSGLIDYREKLKI